MWCGKVASRSGRGGSTTWHDSAALGGIAAGALVRTCDVGRGSVDGVGVAGAVKRAPGGAGGISAGL